MHKKSAILLLKNMRLSSDRLELSGITADDADHIVQWRRDPELIRYFRNPTPLTTDAHHRWFQKYLTDPTRLDFIVTEKVTGSQVGYAGFQDINFKESSAFVAYLIAKQGFGYGSEAVQTLCLYGMNYLKLENLFALIHPQNRASINLVTKLDFTFHHSDDGWSVYRWNE